VAIDPTNSRRIVYVTNDNPYHDTSFATGVWVSCNAGQTFSQYNTGLPMLRVLSVAFDPWTPGRLVIGTDGRGYWQAQLPGCS
jgi:ligand-binding sensor domain-containing protein